MLLSNNVVYHYKKDHQEDHKIKSTQYSPDG